MSEFDQTLLFLSKDITKQETIIDEVSEEQTEEAGVFHKSARHVPLFRQRLMDAFATHSGWIAYCSTEY